MPKIDWKERSKETEKELDEEKAINASLRKRVRDLESFLNKTDEMSFQLEMREKQIDELNQVIADMIETAHNNSRVAEAYRALSSCYDED